MEQTTEKFDAFALVEIMGHTKVAGKARTMTFGSTVMLQVDIPETSKQPAFTKLYGMSSIFSITPVDEETALLHAEAYNVHPIQEWSVQEALRKKVEKEVNEKVDERMRLLEDSRNEPSQHEVEIDNNKDNYYN